MKLIFVLIASFSVSCFLVDYCEALQATNKPNSESDEYLKMGYKTSEGTKSFFAGATLDQLRAYRFDDDLKISMVASWLICKAKFSKQSLKSSGNIELAQLDPEFKAIKREFLGFVSGRLNVEIPEWWRDAFIACPINGLPMFNNQDVLIDYGFVETKGLLHPNRIKIEKNAVDVLEGSSRESPFRINWEPDEDEIWQPKNFRTIDVTTNEKGKVFVAVTHKEDFWVKIHAFGNMGDPLWSSECQDRGIGNVAISPCFVELSVVGDRLYLFGACSTDIFLDVFSTNEGAAISSFSTLRTIDLPSVGKLQDKK